MKILALVLCCFCFINTGCAATTNKKVTVKPPKHVYMPSAVPDGTVFVYGDQVVWAKNPQPAPITNAPATQPATAHGVASAPDAYAAASVYATPAYVPSPVEVEYNPYTGESVAVYSRSPFGGYGGYGYGGRYGFGAYGYNGSFGGSFSGDLSYGLYSYRGNGYSYLYRGGTRSLFGVTFTPRWNYDYYTGPVYIRTYNNVSGGVCADGTFGTGGGAAVYGR